MLGLLAGMVGRSLSAPLIVERLEVRGLSVLSSDEAARRLGVVPGAAVDTLELTGRLGRLLAELADDGRPGATARLWWRSGADERRWIFSLDLDEGEPARFGIVTSAGADSLPRGEVARRTWIEPGKIWRRVDLERQIDDLLSAYDEAGFPYARIRPQLSRDAKGRWAVTLQHEPGPRVRITGLDLRGARESRPAGVMKVMGIRPGQSYRQSSLERGLDRLERTGIFAEVRGAELVPGDDPAHSRIRLSVRELATGSISGIVGYSGADRRLAGYLDFHLRNLGGTGRQLGLRWSSTQKASTTYGLAWREPFLLGRPVDASIDFEHLFFDTLYASTRADLLLHWQPARRLDLSGGVGLDRAVVTAGVRRSEGSGRMQAGIELDTRDSRRAPRRGVQVLARAVRGRTLSGTYGDAAGALQPMVQVDWLAELDRPVRRTTVLSVRASGQSLITDARPLPQYRLFALGGAATLRGYREEQFYAPGYLLGQIEYRIEADRNGSGVHLFLDGALFADPAARARFWPSIDQRKVGFGAGLRLASRLGAVSVDYGMAAGNGPLDGRIHLRAGTEF